jgi:hypothetical protein
MIEEKRKMDPPIKSEDDRGWVAEDDRGWVMTISKKRGSKKRGSKRGSGQFFA